MRITRNRLQDMINEEISRQLLDSQNSALLESYGQGDESLYNIDPADLLDFAKAYVSMGSAVQDQLHDLLDGDYDINPNAVDVMKSALGGMNEQIDTAIAEYENLGSEQ